MGRRIPTRFCLEAIMCAALIAFGAVVRIQLQMIPNFAPVAGLALVAGYAFYYRALAAAVPLGIMLISDQVIGGYDWPIRLTVYSLVTVPVMVGPLLRTALGRGADGSRSWRSGFLALAAVAGSCLASSVVFYLGTNLAVWLASDLYPRTLEGLVGCYVSALPFFRYTLLGDLTFGVGSFAVLSAVTALLGSQSSPSCRPLSER